MPETHREIRTFHLDQHEPGAVVDGFLDIECGTAGVIHLPYRAVRGVSPGRTLCVVAGVHGNEYEGMEAIRQVTSALDPGSMTGNALTLLVANPWAYTARSRATPLEIDGKNLARVFPGDPHGSPTEQLAAALLDLVERHVGADDLFVDLHSGTAEVAFATMVGYRDVESSARNTSEEAARHMGLPLLWAIPDSPGPFNAETARRGIPTIGTETTGRAGCRPEDVAMYERGLWNLLRYLEIVSDRPRPSRDPRPPGTTVNLDAPVSGFVRSPARLGQSVAAGETIAKIVDVFGVLIADITAPVSGTIWAAIESPVVEAGDLLFMIGVEMPAVAGQ